MGSANSRVWSFPASSITNPPVINGLEPFGRERVGTNGGVTVTVTISPGARDEPVGSARNVNAPTGTDLQVLVALDGFVIVKVFEVGAVPHSVAGKLMRFVDSNSGRDGSPLKPALPPLPDAPAFPGMPPSPPIEPAIPPTDPPAPLIEPALPATDPPAPLIEPALPATDPPAPLIEPALPATEPPAPPIEPPTPTAPVPEV